MEKTNRRREIINVSLLIASFLVMVGLVSAAYYVKDPNNCPTSYQSQTCSGITKVCGYSGGVTFCYDPAGILPPTVARSVSTTNYACSDTTCNGGYVIDCYYYDGTAPHCDYGNTGFCDRNSTCYDKHVQTTCTANLFGIAPCSSSCISGYVYCDTSSTDDDGCEVQSGVTNCDVGDNNNINSSCTCVCDTNYLDCDESGAGAGNGCEVNDGGSCNVGSLSGTYSGCTCVVTKSYFETGTYAEYSTNTTQDFLWGKDYGVGNLLNLTNAKNKSFFVDSTLNAITPANMTADYFIGDGSKLQNVNTSGGVEVDPQWSANLTLFGGGNQTNWIQSVYSTTVNVLSWIAGNLTSIMEMISGNRTELMGYIDANYTISLSYSDTNDTALRNEITGINTTADIRQAINNTKLWANNIDITGGNIINVSYVYLNSISGACDLSVNGTICKNSTGTYIIG